MIPHLLSVLGQRRVWAGGVLVVVSLVVGLHAGDRQASGAAHGPQSLVSELTQRRLEVATARLQAESAERSVQVARRRTARAALTALDAGAPGARALLPAGMRFACLDRHSRRCVVVADHRDRSVSLVWPAHRPAWAAAVGLPRGVCDGAPRWPTRNGLDSCERSWLELPPMDLVW